MATCITANKSTTQEFPTESTMQHLKHVVRTPTNHANHGLT